MALVSPHRHCADLFCDVLLIDVYAKLPFAVAPGMGINAFFTFTIILSQRSGGGASVSFGRCFVSAYFGDTVTNH